MNGALSHSNGSKVSAFQARLEQAGYIAERSLAATLVLFSELGRPLLLEGDAGVGKTEVAQVLARLFACPLIRLQCYEGLDVNSAVYEWNYQHQLLAIKLLERDVTTRTTPRTTSSAPTICWNVPLLRAISQPESPVLLVDEIDRADEEFEAYLLEVLSDFQITIPEFGTIKATTPAVCDSHLQRHPGTQRCAPPPLSVSLRGLPGLRQRTEHCPVPAAGDRSRGWRDRWWVCASPAKTDCARPRHRRDPGLGGRLGPPEVQSLDQDPETLIDSLVCLLKTREDSESADRPRLQRLVARAL